MKRELAGTVIAIAEASNGRDPGVGEPPSSGGEGPDLRRPRAASSRPSPRIAFIVIMIVAAVVHLIEAVNLLLGTRVRLGGQRRRGG